jgi:chromosomal replication initiation ATPase DnaA
MKKDIFTQYLNAIVKLYKIDKSVIVSNNKEKDVVDAKQMLYYLCNKRQMTVSQIQKFMAEEGYDPKHCSIIRGIKRIELKVADDPDYKTITTRINNSVFI